MTASARSLRHAANAAGQARLSTYQFASAFNAEWILAGGDAPAMFRFDPSPDVLRLLKRELGNNRFDVALLAVDGADAARAKPYIGSIPSYTSSEVNERQSPDMLRDLDNVRFVEMPWLANADTGAPSDGKRPEYSNPALERLLDRTPIRDLQQALTLLRRKVTFQLDLTLDHVRTHLALLARLTIRLV